LEKPFLHQEMISTLATRHKEITIFALGRNRVVPTSSSPGCARRPAAPRPLARSSVVASARALAGLQRLARSLVGRRVCQRACRPPHPPARLPARPTSPVTLDLPVRAGPVQAAPPWLLASAAPPREPRPAAPHLASTVYGPRLPRPAAAGWSRGPSPRRRRPEQGEEQGPPSPHALPTGSPTS
jgi:hypothetical protein